MSVPANEKFSSREAISLFGYLYLRTTFSDVRILIKGDEAGERALNKRINNRIKTKELFYRLHFKHATKKANHCVNKKKKNLSASSKKELLPQKLLFSL